MRRIKRFAAAWVSMLVSAAVLTGVSAPGAGADAISAVSSRATTPVTSDFDGDGRADLAITTPFDDITGAENAGSVTVLYGSRDGLGAQRSRRFSQWNGPT